MVKLSTPKTAVLPNGRTLYAKYKRAAQDALPNNARLERTCRRRAPSARHSRGIKNVLKVVINGVPRTNFFSSSERSSYLSRACFECFSLFLFDNIMLTFLYIGKK